MDARDNGNNNPFANGICSLEWIACAMDAARRHNERRHDPRGRGDGSPDDAKARHEDDAA
ncbi:MAG: hypothetical protein JXB36_13945 [Gammaproteobacteria bacterium]|nr:hypothetical protein [Gammaproteobacteria bacterium]